ncbi:MAG: hypothetical protein EKK53_09260 [Burkholderiales bacterium]|nr:MAG: hypothetical protein EKK53_09260 [Burkholderiales bacterium]
MPHHPSFARAAAVAASLLPLAALAQYATPMRNVDNPDRQPYQETASISISPPFVNGFMFFPTPAGKRVVLEWAGVNCSSTSSADVFPLIYLNVTRANGSQNNMALAPMLRTGSNVFINNVSLGQTVLKAYSESVPGVADGGSGISLNIFHSDSTQNVFCIATLTGHLLVP